MSQAQVTEDDHSLRDTFHERERETILRNNRIGAILGVIFMPAGAVLDLVVYSGESFLGEFFVVRLVCALLMGGLWFLFDSEFGRRHYRPLGQILVSLPMASIAWMIYTEGGASSTYYAGINLVIVVTGILIRWRLSDTGWMCFIGISMYLVACFLHAGGIGSWSVFFNNLYFLVLTAIFSVTGNYIYERLRFSEFRLQEELNQNRAELENKNGKLMEMDRIKSQFYANISHELRTPLTLLLTPMDALMSRISGQSDPKSSDLVRTMQTNGMRLLKLINDLLDLVRLDSGNLGVKREKLDLDEFLNGLMSSLRQAAEKRKIQLAAKVADDISTAIIDSDKLEKVILNLVFNALKFTGVGGVIKVEAERDGSDLIIRVSDTGSGIPADKVPFIFDRFWQVDNSAHRKHRGAGIGLALVKELIEVQGGTVEVQSVEGEGTVFELRLPQENEGVPLTVNLDEETRRPELATAADSGESDEWLEHLFRRAELFPAISTEPAFAPRDEWMSNSRQPKVLVADDEPDMLSFLHGQLDTHYQVLDAVDGLQALEKAAQFLPDGIILDMMMPEKDGLEVCRELRARATTQNIPVILLTARADEETKLRALDAGANDFLAKPFSLTELHVRLKNLVELYQQQRQLARQKQILESTLEQLKETETQLVQSEKMASLGKLSAGIIHEINNPLNFAKSGMYLLKQFRSSLDPDDHGDFDDVMHDVQEGIDRVIGIVSDLRGFSHPDVGLKKEASVEKIMTSTLRLLSGEWKDKVEIETDVAPGLTFEANANQITQVTVNIVQNAIDAMDRKSFGEEEKPRIWISAREEGDNVVIQIKDNGPGISEEHLGRIFDPFFTTRDVGEGVGLGLSICYKIVERHGGHVDVRTEFGKYCEFELTFPKLALAESVVQE